MSLRRIPPSELKRRIDGAGPLLVLDVRRPEAFRRKPAGIAGAVPLLLDAPEPWIPDVPRETPVVAYCLCSGQASSTRAALWLTAAGYTDVAVLEGGLPAWQAEKLPLAPISPDDRTRVGAWVAPPPTPAPAAVGSRLIAESAFLAGEQLPVRRDMAVLFVDMVNSTQLLFTRRPEDVLRLVQAFMEVVVNVAVQHCGDVHDFEGDGAMLYFAGVGEAVPAAFNLRAALNGRRHELPELPQARFALDAGPLVVGHIGAAERRALSFIGPCVNAAARILKLAPPGGIVATGRVVDQAERTDPDLAAQFVALPDRHLLKGWKEPVLVYVAADRNACPEHCHDTRSES
ncbi:MAG: rhodanese-like domain-containing protein [Sinimarinibacterium sp.]|jgi:class 3 adenylate cyclase/rhodanese-related sulfurtransferase